MAFLAALPAIASLVGTGVGVAGQMGAFGGGQQDAGQEAAQLSGPNINLGLLDYIRGQQQLQQYNDLLSQVTGQWNSDRSIESLLRQQAVDTYSPLEQAQADYLRQTMNSYMPYMQQGLGYLSHQMGNMQQLSDAAMPDIMAALDMSQNVYRPLEKRTLERMDQDLYPAAMRNLGRGENELWPATQDAYQKSLDYFKEMKEGIDPEQWASQAKSDALSGFEQQLAAANRQRSAYGIDPTSGVAQAADIQAATDAALQGSGAATQARQKAIMQNREDYGKGLSAVQGGVGLMNNSLGTINTQVGQLGNVLFNTLSGVQKGPMSFGLPVMQTVNQFNPGMGRSLLPDTSLTAGSLLRSWSPNSSASMPNYTAVGSMATDNMRQLAKAYGQQNNSYYSGLSAQNAANAAESKGYGSLAGLGAGSLMYGGNKSWDSLAGLFGSGSGTSTGSGSYAPTIFKDPTSSGTMFSDAFLNRSF